MSTATLTLPSAEDIRTAAFDDDVFDDLWHRLSEADRPAFVQAVKDAYNALTDGEIAILDFARDRLPYFRTKGALEQAILYQFEHSATRYYQRLNALINRPEALEAYPELVNRLRRRRALRQAQRSTRTAASVTA